MTGDGQRRGARRDDGVSLSDERGLKNGFGKPLCNESAGHKGTCSRAPEDLGAALRCVVKDAVMANVRGILLNSYRRDNIAAEDRV